MQFIKPRFRLAALCGTLALAVVAAGASRAAAQSSALDCEDGLCPPRITQITFEGREAYRLSDGKTAAVIVPALGRVMSYGLVNGPNWLYVARNVKAKAGQWVNWGGDKTWPAPQSAWPTWQSNGGWPPPSAWDGQAHSAEVLSGGKVRLTSKVQPGMGARIVRTMSIDDKGDLVIEQVVEKVSGAPLPLSIWSVTQIAPPDAVFLPTKAGSTYANNFGWISNETHTDAGAVAISPTLLRVVPSTSGTFKIGTEAPVVAIAAVKNGVAFVQRAARPDGEYPDGAKGGGGFPVELFNNVKPAYSELELLSPIRIARKGARWQHTVRWSLHQLPNKDAASPEVAAAIEKLFGTL